MTRRPTLRHYVVHGVRVALFVAIIALIRWQHLNSAPAKTEFLGFPIQRVSKFFPGAVRVESRDDGSGTVLDESGSSLGYVIQTSPKSDHIIGFSGPTNVLVAFGPDDRIRGLDVLSSGDTRDHLKQVLGDDTFLTSLNSLTWNEAASASQVDGVSGATLTSLAIRESIIYRLGGGRESLRFPEPLAIEKVRSLFADTSSISQDQSQPSLWLVLNREQTQIGTVLRTSPAADNLVGYQGPSETLIGFDMAQRVVGIVLGKSYDNEEYVTYVREDEYFATLFNGLLLEELAGLDLEAAEVEGVSGATMTSMAVAQGLLVAAQDHIEQSAAKARAEARSAAVPVTANDLGTALVVVVGVVIGMTSLRSNRRVRLLFQLVLVGYVGLAAGNLVSQAMLAGWAKHGVPWRSAMGLVFLSIAAFALPITTRRNIYCSHLCPHGAAQQLLRRRIVRTVRLPSTVKSFLVLIPGLLLLWCVIVAMTSLGFSLVDIEPFDAYVFRIAGWATISVAIVGLIAASFIPMAYCRYGCPTGALLEFLRFNARSDRWTRRDWVAVAYVLLAFVVCLW